MKIAICSKGNTLDAEVDPRFGRCKYFLIVDTESRQVEVVDNSENLNRAGGAGIQSAELISSSGAEALLTGHCGPNAFTTLNAAGLRVFTGIEGSASEAIDQFNRGDLKAMSAPDVEGHW
ncbi:MAG TPA: dinitrogenase iron-molybdenum cofactor biosynthesis protein [Bacteroidetes bacterium]|nr:dinitrogenase iron-molybdenum cofactor biosynthesis protein [Bacteroidota bacterium]